MGAMTKMAVGFHADVLSVGLSSDDSQTRAEFLLDTTDMGLPNDWLAMYAERLARAHAAMVALEAGAIANADEQRMVGHYWLRNASKAPTKTLAETIETTNAQIEQFAKAVHQGEVLSSTNQRFRKFLLIGIGGSALGPQFVASALGQPTPSPDSLAPFFLDNTDPDGFARVLTQLASTGGGLGETLVLVVSKSGGTRETTNGMHVTRAAFASVGLPFARHAIAITQAGSALSRLAQQEGFLAVFPMWDFVGGRTSELSAVGLLPAALQGFDIRALLSGAKAMDEATRDPDPLRNPAMKMAVCWHHASGGRGERALVVLPYKDRLELFARYLQQLVMESLGKELDRNGNVVHQGLSVYGNKGATDQHAYVQQLRDGPDNFFVTFIEVLTDITSQNPFVGKPLFVEEGVTSGDYLLGFLLGTRQALAEKGRRSLTLTMTEVSAHSIGALLALFERTVGYYAEMICVNAYHQPGVEAGKRAAERVLNLQKNLLLALCDTPRTAQELAQEAGFPNEGLWAFKILEHLSQNHRIRRLRTPQEPLTETRYHK